MENTKNTELLEPITNDTKFKGFMGKVSRFYKKYNYMIFAGLIPAVIFFLVYLVRGIHPFGPSTVLVLDMNAQYAYFYEYLREAVLGGDLSLIYTWERALGGEFMGLYAYYIASPLSYIVCLFPKENMQDALFMIYLIKAALCGVTMSYYLTKTSKKLEKYSVVAFSTLYATTAYMMVQMHNLMWIDAVILLPLVVLGIEQLIKFGKYKLYIVCLALTMMSNYYIGYMVCIFVVLYYFYYMFAYSDRNNPIGEKNHFRKSFIRIATYSVIGVAIAAFIIFGAYYSLGLGKNEFSNPKWGEIKMNYELMDILYKFLPGSYDTVRPEGLPFVYCGVLTIMLVPAYFCSKKFSQRERIWSAILIIVLVLGFMVSTFDLIWHGFQRPNWLNCRFSFTLCFFLITLAYRVYTKLDAIAGRNFIVSSACIVAFAMMIQKIAETLKEENEHIVIDEYATVLLTIACVAVYLILIACRKSGKNREVVTVILLCTICAEVFISGLTNVNDLDDDVTFTKYDKYAQYNTLMLPITDTINYYDGGFFRAETVTHRKPNDNMAINLNGLTNSTSSINADTILFLRMMGYSSKSNWSKYLGGNPVSDSLLGIKYIISPRNYDDIYGEPVYTAEEFAKLNGMTVEELIESTYADNASGEKYHGTSAADYVVYKNPYALSLAFPSEGAIDPEQMQEFNIDVATDSANYEKLYNEHGHTLAFERINEMISKILGRDVKVFAPATQLDAPVLDGVKQMSSNKNTHTKYEYTDGTGTITYTYTVPTNTRLYLQLPAYYLNETKIIASTTPIVDNTLAVQGNETNRIIELGAVMSSEETAEYSFTVILSNKAADKAKFYTSNNDSFIYYIDEEVFKSSFAEMQKGQLVIDSDYKDHNITGTMVTDKADQMITTTIPYDRGWRVFVDGKAVDSYEVANALLAFDIKDAGQHDIKFVYAPTALVLGIGISVVATIFFALLIFFEKWLRKLKPIRDIYLIDTDYEEEDTPMDETFTEEIPYDSGFMSLKYGNPTSQTASTKKPSAKKKK